MCVSCVPWYFMYVINVYIAIHSSIEISCMYNGSEIVQESTMSAIATIIMII